ncbi:MAG TPA: FecR family protein [Planctomycetota bacterium]|nr:FecR family protein [Planctomycetota bacterium]
MNEPVRIDVERYLAGGMSDEETERFLLSVRQDPDALALLGRALEDQAYLYDALRSRTDSDSLPARDTARLVLKTRRVPLGPRPEGGPAAGWITGAIAATILILLVYSSTTPRTKPAAPTPAPVARTIAVPPATSPEPVRPEPVVPPTPPAPKVAMPEPPAPLPVAPEPPAPVPAPAPKEKPAPPTLVMPPESPKKSLPVIAKIEQTAAGVTLLDAAGPSEARNALTLSSGQGLETGAAGGALLRFNDGTKIELAPNTLVREIVEEPATGKKILLAQGSVLGDIARQPTGKPFLFTTPHATAKVLGTVLRLTVEAKYTKLEVREGKVQLKRNSDNKAVDVVAGFFAIAADGGDLAAKPSPVDEVLLGPLQGEIGGNEWRAVQDPAAPGGVALEALRTTNRQPFKQTADAARVTWVFRADAGRDYYVWARGCTLAKVDPIKHDAVFLEFLDSKVTEREGPSKGNAGGGERAIYNGYMHGNGYWWVGGDADGNNDEQPVVVRFNRPGLQTVRLYAAETPIRIDAIWISATQKTRPDAQGGPAAERK